jgi:hypothetical protein
LRRTTCPSHLLNCTNANVTYNTWCLVGFYPEPGRSPNTCMRRANYYIRRYSTASVSCSTRFSGTTGAEGYLPRRSSELTYPSATGYPGHAGCRSSRTLFTTLRPTGSTGRVHASAMVGRTETCQRHTKRRISDREEIGVMSQGIIRPDCVEPTDREIGAGSPQTSTYIQRLEEGVKGTGGEKP